MQISARVICDSLTAVIENSCHADRRCSHLGDGSHAPRRGGSLDAPDHKSYPFVRQGGQRFGMMRSSTLSPCLATQSSNSSQSRPGVGRDFGEMTCTPLTGM